jgi:steroid 5-alpha reductase family enzyme
VSLQQLIVLSVCVAGALGSVMAAAWYVQRRSGNSGWVDVFWTFGVGGVAIVAALAPLGSSPLPDWRQTVVALMVAAWSLRLGLHIAARTRSSGDDPRYRQLSAEWGQEAPQRLFWFLQAQAGVGAILAIAVALAAHNANPTLRIQDVVGVLVLAAALLGEAVSDLQLQRFKARSPGRVCDVGLWRWSRHPNYFFERLAWLAYPIISIDCAGHNPFGWLALLAPACMYWVLVHVSGIPPLESRMLRTRGDAFRAYQQRTRPFLPLPIFRRGE